VLALARRRSDVRYAGAVPAASMPGLIGAAAVIVVPSVWDDVCPMIAVEAMALGRPVLATARGGLPYLVGTDGGEVVEATSGALRAGLRRLLDAGPAAGRAARARYERLFSPAVITSALIGVYERVLARR
jgi:glycosyltransferase involved in cell wall biosynthesis